MMRLRAFGIGLLLVGFTGLVQAPLVHSMPQPSAPTLAAQFSPENPDLTQLFSHIWRVSDAPDAPLPGRIFIFLPNGTLLETSCVETYRIATWTIDKSAPTVLRVVEDGQLAFTAVIAELTDTTLTLQNTLVRSDDQQTVTLTAVEEEFVCPDLPR